MNLLVFETLTVLPNWSKITTLSKAAPSNAMFTSWLAGLGNRFKVIPCNSSNATLIFTVKVAVEVQLPLIAVNVTV